MESKQNIFRFILTYYKNTNNKIAEQSAILSTTLSARIFTVLTFLLEIGFMIVTVVQPSYYGDYMLYYRLCYITYMLNCLTLLFFTFWAKKNINTRITTIKIINSICYSIYMLWSIAVSFLDQLNGYSTSPIIFMSMTILLVASVYITPVFFIIADLFSNFLYILLMVRGMNLGSVTLGEITNYSVFAGVGLIVCLSFLYNRFRYYTKVNESVTEKVKAERTEELLEQTTTALALTIDAKDKYTNGHSIRVAKYSRMIAERMNLDETLQKEIYYMGLLHDVGKIGVPGDIINKSSALTEDEYNIIKQHPTIGNDILGTITAMPSLSYGALYHHERYDGKGYPTGMKGEEIPVEAKIICIADAYDAMTSNRSYRNILPQEKVKEEIEKGKGNQFDPKIADIMIELIDEDTEYNLREK